MIDPGLCGDAPAIAGPVAAGSAGSGGSCGGKSCGSCAACWLAAGPLTYWNGQTSKQAQPRAYPNQCFSSLGGLGLGLL